MPEVTRLKKVAVLGRESTLSPLGHVALPRRREHEASTDTDVSPFHSSNPFAMIDITSSDQLGCIMSFPHGQHRLRHAPRTNHSALDEGEEKKKKSCHQKTKEVTTPNSPSSTTQGFKVRAARQHMANQLLV